MKQISIFEILENRKTVPDWIEIKAGDIVKFDRIVPVVTPATDVRRDVAMIDKTFNGTVNGTPAVIGCRTWLRTLWTKNEFFEEYQPIQWRAKP